MSFVPHSDADRREMLAQIGLSAVDDLFADIPADLWLDAPLDLPPALSEWEAVRLLDETASENANLTCFAGAGIYDHHIPAAGDHLIRRSEFYTAYTPYQPEVSQGTLQSIYEFQTMVCELTGLEVANASMYDGATGTAEAVLMAMRITRRQRIALADNLHPYYRAVIETYTQGLEPTIDTLKAGESGTIGPEAVASLPEDTACLVVQNPNFFGLIEDLEPLAGAAHEVGALLVCAVADPVSLAVIRPPGDAGADIVAAEGQPFGNAQSFGGPVVGLFAARKKLVRSLPGRLVGAAFDHRGRRGYVLTLQAREQQIRREKATSNICTNQGLNALAATIYLALVGRAGLRQVAETSIQYAHYAAERIGELDGFELMFPDAAFVREFAVRTSEPSREIVLRCLDHGLLAGVSLSRFPGLDVDDGLLLAFTEKRSRAEIDRLVDALAGRSGD